MTTGRPRSPARPVARPRRRRLVTAAAGAAFVVGALSVTVPGGAVAGTGEPAEPGTTAVAAPPGTVAGGEVVATPSAPTPRDEAERACLVSGRPVMALDPSHETQWPDRDLDLPNGTSVDARSETFDNSRLDDSGFGLGVKIHRTGERQDLCFVGGTITTTLDPESTSWDAWHRITAMTIETPGFTVVGTSFANEGDLIAFIGDARNWRVVGVRADGRGARAGAYAHDDCVENDQMASGTIDDSKFDGCNTFLSATNASEHPIDGGDDEVVVRNSLVRLQPYRNSFNTLKYGEDQHGGFFKWADVDSAVMIPPRLTVTDSVFRSDTRAVYGGNQNGFLGLPPGTTCRDVVLIGTESWRAEDLRSWIDQCDGLVLGSAADWDAAVTAWDAAHPPMRDLGGQARDLVAAASGW